MRHVVGDSTRTRASPAVSRAGGRGCRSPHRQRQQISCVRPSRSSWRKRIMCLWVCCDSLSDYDTPHSTAMPPRRPPPQHAAAAASLPADSNPVPAVPADQTSIAAGGGFDILTAVAALTGQSASQLRAFAERYRHREGVVRTDGPAAGARSLAPVPVHMRISFGGAVGGRCDGGGGSGEGDGGAGGRLWTGHAGARSVSSRSAQSTSMRLRSMMSSHWFPHSSAVLCACCDPANTSATRTYSWCVRVLPSLCSFSLCHPRAVFSAGGWLRDVPHDVVNAIAWRAD